MMSPSTKIPPNLPFPTGEISGVFITLCGPKVLDNSFGLFRISSLEFCLKGSQSCNFFLVAVYMSAGTVGIHRSVLESRLPRNKLLQ